MDYTDWTNLLARMLKVLSIAQEERKKRSDWVEYERACMFKAVQEERAKLGKGPMPMSRIEKVEGTAMGHTDYSRKFALYCAELVKE